MGYISKEVYDWHITRVWDKRKAAVEDSKQRYWSRVLAALRSDLEGKSSLPELSGGP